MTRVLVVEDDAIIGSHISETLARLGYDVPAIADYGEGALREAATHRPDIVLMDIQLRGAMDGIETASRLRRTSDVPVIYLTAHTDEATLARAKETAPHGYLVKPFNERDLRTSIEVAIRKHELERHVVERERWFATTFASLGEAVIATDAEEHVTFMNPVAEAVTGFGVAAARGRPLGEVFRLVDATGATRGEAPVGAHSDGFAVAVPANTQIVDRAGARRLLDDTARPIVDEQGKILGRVIVFRDVTERKRLERRLEIAERLASLGTMASGLAHELNNPLAAVMGNVAFALEELDGLERPDRRGTSVAGHLDACRSALKDAATASERLRKIVETMRWFVSRRAPEPAVADVPDLVESALKLTEYALASRAKIVRAYGTTPFVEVDEGHLVQALMNLFANAAEAMPEGRASEHQIAIATWTDDAGRAVVEIRHDGAGLPQADVARLFEPSFLGTPSANAKGLGLAISHSFVTAAGGELAFESRSGRGGVFRVSLPPATRRAAVVTAPAAAPPRSRARILVLDDEPAVAKVIVRLLSDHDVSVETDGRAALSRIAKGEKFDVIFCDLMMPELTGADVYDSIHSADPGLAAKMVFLTGGAFSPRISEFLRHVPNRVLDKPFSAEKLRAAIAALAER
jgi:PAS domain S-box-containing protein